MPLRLPAELSTVLEHLSPCQHSLPLAHLKSDLLKHQPAKALKAPDQPTANRGQGTNCRAKEAPERQPTANQEGQGTNWGQSSNCQPGPRRHQLGPTRPLLTWAKAQTRAKSTRPTANRGQGTRAKAKSTRPRHQLANRRQGTNWGQSTRPTANRGQGTNWGQSTRPTANRGQGTN